MFDPMAHMIDLKGKKYLQVMWRLVWFREEHPDWNIDTHLIDHQSGESAVFCCNISDGGRQLSTGHGSETRKDFKDYLEKAETKAVGRALAMLGYGTQFAPELDEGERIVDSPVQKPAELISTEQAFDLQQSVEEVGDLDKFLGAFGLAKIVDMTVDMLPRAERLIENQRKRT